MCCVTVMNIWRHEIGRREYLREYFREYLREYFREYLREYFRE